MPNGREPGVPCKYYEYNINTGSCICTKTRRDCISTYDYTCPNYKKSNAVNKLALVSIIAAVASFIIFFLAFNFAMFLLGAAFFVTSMVLAVISRSTASIIISGIIIIASAAIFFGYLG